MQTVAIIKKILILSISILLLNGCSYHQSDIATTIPIDGENIVMIDEEQNYETDMGTTIPIDGKNIVMINEEQNYETDIDPFFVIEDPSWTTELIIDPDAFTADKYVQKAPVISYKHKFDTEFHDKPRWRTANE